MNTAFSLGFRSFLAEDLSSYVTLKRAMGMKFDSTAKVLLHLDAFIAEHYDMATELTRDMLEAWLGREPHIAPSTQSLCIGIARQFCLYRQRRNPQILIPNRDTCPTLWPGTVAKYLPHIFTTEEIRMALAAARRLPPTKGNAHRGETFATLILLLYGTGMRLGEAMRLQWKDVDWVARTLCVRETKFFKTRLIPVASDLFLVLEKYHALLRCEGQPVPPDSALLQRDGRHGYSKITVGAVVRRLFREADIKPAEGRKGPRVHDLRHTFAVHRLAQWYRSGADVQNLLPRLATYLGHESIHSTQYYLTLTPDILESASLRFEAACGPGKKG